MKTFAFLFHPTSMRQVKHFWPITTILPDSVVPSFLKNKDFKVLHIKKFKSASGKEIQGFLICCPMSPEQIFETDEETILDKIVSAGYLARKLEAQIMGVSGYFSAATDKKPMIYKHVKTAITSGSSFSAWSIFEALYRTAKDRHLHLKTATLTIFSPTNTISSLCARKLADHVGKIILSGGPTEKLDSLRDLLRKTNTIPIEIEQDTPKAIKQADIILNSYNGPSVLFNMNDVKPEAILCDAAVFKHVAEKARQRKDLTVLDCGIIKLPLGQKISLHQGIPDHAIYAPMAEAMLLALEDKCVNFSLGENVNMDKMEDIANMAAMHGFEIEIPD